MTRIITLFSLFLIFIGLHTGVALAHGKTLLAPYVLCFVGATAIFTVTIHRIKFRHVGLLGALTVVLMVLAVITSLSDGQLGQHLISTCLLVYALVIAYGTFIGLQVIGPWRASRFFLVMAIFLIVGSYLEIYAGLKPVSDAFRSAVSSWNPGVVYSSDLRDQLQYGGIRPKFFSSEPSVLGRSIGFAILFWFLPVRRFSGFRLFGAMFLTVSAFFVVRSPTILICAIVLGTVWLSQFGRKATAKVRMAFLSAIVLATMLAAPQVVASYTQYGQSASFFIREIGPPLVAAEVLRAQPFFGTGIGGYSQALPFDRDVFTKAGGTAETQLTKMAYEGAKGSKDLITSMAWEYWIDLGILGGIVVAWLLWRVIARLGVPHRFFVFCCSACLFTLNGGLNLPAGWIGFLCFACLYEMHAAAAEQTEPSTAEAPQTPRVAELPA